MIKNEEDLIDGDKLRQKLEFALPHAKKTVAFISAYITQTAIDWFCNLLPPCIEVRVICRLLPSDVLSGSSQLSALSTALEKGIRVSCLHSLHAKIYAIDDEIIYVGSANLTNNGLKIYGVGNLEASIKINASQPNLAFIDNICVSSTELDEEILKKMQSCIDLKESKIFFDKWPEGVLKEEEGIWVRDFFWTQPGTDENSLEQIHDFELLGIESFDSTKEALKLQVLKARCVRWLIGKLEVASENELYFGTLTKILHDELKDDPSPYRKDIKSLLQNMLAYCEEYLKTEIEITKPSHSQKIKLLHKACPGS